MLLCGWPKRKNKQSKSQDRCDSNVPIGEGKTETEASIPDTVNSSQNFSQSMLFIHFIFLKLGAPHWMN